MRVLLDHCVDRRLASLLPAHDVRTAAEMGWQTLRNGQLLSAGAQGKFDLLLTIDQNLRYQQPLRRLPLPVVEINSRDTRLEALAAFAPFLPDAIEASKEFRFVSVDASGRLERLAPRNGE